MYDFALAGNIIVDTIKYIPAYPNKLELTHIRNMHSQLGGLVCNVGCTLAQLDPDAKLAIIGRIGSDADGELVEKILGSHKGMDLRYVQKSGRTSFTDVFTVESTGERTFFTYSGADGTLTPEDIPYEALRGTLLHIGYALLLPAMDAYDAEYGTVLARTLAYARQHGIQTSVDIVSENSNRVPNIVCPALKYADYLTVNEFEAGMITGIPLRNAEGTLLAERLPVVCRRLKDMGVGRWVTVHMPETACGTDECGMYWECKSLDLPKGFITSSVGAGDAFVAGLLYMAKRGAALPEALRAANAVAASKLSKEGVQPLREVMKLYEKYPVRV